MEIEEGREVMDVEERVQAVHAVALLLVQEIRGIEPRPGAQPRRYPARRYVMVDDKIQILAAIKAIWKERVTTVFVRQGHYALDARLVAASPPADVTVEAIGDMIELADSL